MPLTTREKNAIRSMPCGKCGAVPPFPDGSRCHPHRLVPAEGYVANNVVPRCPSCHASEHGSAKCTKHAYQAGLRTHELHPGLARANGRRTHELHPELAQENASKGARTLNAQLTPAERSANAREAGRARMASMTPEQRSDLARKCGFISGPKNVAAMNADPANRIKGIRVREERKRRDGLTPGELAHVREAGRISGHRNGLALRAKLTDAEYSEMRRRGWITRRAKQAASRARICR